MASPPVFDPYHRWLAIPPTEQPPNHYRLLALALFESDPDVIGQAADQRMGHLRTFQRGPQSALSQRLLNEVAAAQVCLLNAERKAAYDAQLRAGLGNHPAGVAAALPASAAPQADSGSASLMDSFAVPGVESSDFRSERGSVGRKRTTRGKQSGMKGPGTYGIVVSAVAIVGLAAILWVRANHWQIQLVDADPQAVPKQGAQGRQIASTKASDSKPRGEEKGRASADHADIDAARRAGSIAKSTSVSRRSPEIQRSEAAIPANDARFGDTKVDHPSGKTPSEGVPGVNPTSEAKPAVLPSAVKSAGADASTVASNTATPEPAAQPAIAIPKSTVKEESQPAPAGTAPAAKAPSNTLSEAQRSILERARKKNTAVRAATAQKFLERFDKEIAALRKDSKLPAAERLKFTDILKKEREAFKEGGRLPWSAPMRAAAFEYVKARINAEAELSIAYDRVIDQLTRKEGDETAADVLKQKNEAIAPTIVAVWMYTGSDDGHIWPRQLYSNGKVDDPSGESTWTFDGKTLVVKAASPQAPGGFWIDRCEVAADGETLTGGNQFGSSFSAKLTKTP